MITVGSRSLIIAVGKVLACAAARGDGPVQVEIVEDSNESAVTRYEVTAVYDGDGEPIPIEPDPKLEFDEVWRTMSDQEAIQRLDRLAEVENPFTSTDSVTVARDFSCLESRAQFIDPGGLGRIKAIWRLCREYEKLGRDPLCLGWSIPMARVTGFESAPVLLAASPLYYSLSKESAAFIERSHRPLFEKALDDPEFGLIFDGQVLGQPPQYDRYYVSLMRHLLSTGFASREFAAWARDRAIGEIKAYLNGQSRSPALFTADFRMLSYYDVLSAEHIRDLLNAVAEALLVPKVARDDDIKDLLLEVISLPGFAAQDAATLLPVIVQAESSQPGQPRRFADVVERTFERFSEPPLYQAGKTPQAILDYRGRKIAGSDAATVRQQPAFARISIWRFPIGAEPQCLHEWKSELGITWGVLRCGEVESDGIVALRRSGSEVFWTHHFGKGFPIGGRQTWTRESKPARVRMAHQIHMPIWDDIRHLSKPVPFDVQVLELGPGPIASGRIALPELMTLVIDSVSDEVALGLAAFAWIGERNDPFLRELLAGTCRQGDTNDNWSAVAAGRVLASQRSFAALESMLPHLLDRSSKATGTRPLVAVFRALAKEKDVPHEIKRSWARQCVKLHLNGRVGRQKAVELMRVVTELSGDTFGFDSGKAADQNAPAFARAQQWAWKGT